MPKLQKIAILISLINISTTCLSQETKSVNRISISDLYLQAGFSGGFNENPTINDIRALVPNSGILKSYSELNPSMNDYSFNANTYSSIQLGLSFRNKDKSAYKTNPHLRIGITNVSNNSISARSFSETRSPSDTLISNQTNQVIYVDSVTSRSFSVNYISQQLRLDASLLFRSNQAARWSVMAGVGASYGVSINAKTRVEYFKYGREEMTQYNSEKIYHYGKTSETFITEIIANKINSGYSFYIPMGFDFRIGNKSEFWKHAHLFYEVRPGINFTNIPELQTYRAINVQQGVGLRVML